MRLVTRTSHERMLRIDTGSRRGARVPDDSPEGDASAPTPRRVRIFFVVVALVAAMAGSVIAWESGLKYRFTAKRWGVVVPGKIYRSGQVSRWVLADQLASHGIAEVIDLNGIE